MLLLWLLAALAGAVVAAQPPVNAQLRVAIGGPIWSAFASFIVGAVGLLVYALVTEPHGMALRAGLSRGPWWIWTGGLLGAFYVASTLELAPRLGVTVLMALAVAGQMLTSLVIDRFGLFGMPVAHPSGLRLAGTLLVVVGAALVSGAR